MATPRLSPAKLQAACDKFNATYPIGTTMHAWTGAMGEGEPKVGQIREPGAYVMSGHSAVVHMDGVRGCVSLTHVRSA